MLARWGWRLVLAGLVLMGFVAILVRGGGAWISLGSALAHAVTAMLGLGLLSLMAVFWLRAVPWFADMMNASTVPWMPKDDGASEEPKATQGER